MTAIHYLYRRPGGEFAGSGTYPLDQADLGSTTHPCLMEEDGPLPRWTGIGWELPLSTGQQDEGTAGQP